LKAVAAIECYRDVVLCTVDPGLSDISQKLAEIAEKERRAANQFTLNSSDLAHSTGMIHLNEPQVIQSLRRECRLLHYSIRTEKAYAGWVARFLKRYGLDDEDSFTAVGAPEVKAFLSGLAIHGKVAPSTQNQAFNALLFLFRRVLQRKLEFVDAVRANRPPRLPVVLSRDQAQRLLGALSGRDKLMAQLMYGAGLRLMECLRLRVKDVAFDLGQIIVREGKGDKDRITVLPKAARDGLQFQIELVRNLRNSLVC
jgi:integrase